ncbi:hypothetical protein HRM2_44640 [Desulforapulum autotrophicum HRM2]|uniref:Uncharacterized protein n=1 Tax=Desulforapulum autotrophicum (strain ATCC 43914 / DSM 3382 / VKM B-1955 / HRM2) TaxID=177437 RepID=C0QF19_DESAH|nr:hypothetical protein HRM2_44640 [Desulforapulum autotrophicum HRM2]
MIPLDTLTRQSLFSLLYAIDQKLAEQTKEAGCPIAGGRCIFPTISASLEVALLNCKRFLKSVSACVVDVKAVAAEPRLRRYDFGAGGFIGLL